MPKIYRVRIQEDPDFRRNMAPQKISRSCEEEVKWAERYVDFNKKLCFKFS